MSEKIRYAAVVTSSYTSYWAYKDIAGLKRTISAIDRILERPTPSIIRIDISKDVVSKTQYWADFKKGLRKFGFRNDDNFNLGSLVEQ